MSKLLIVAGDPCIHDAMRRAVASPGAGVEVLAAWNAGDGWRRIRCDGPDALVIDLDLPGGSGLELFDRVRVADPKILTVFVTTERTADAAVEAMTRGAFDYLLRPLTRRQVSRRLGAALRAASLMRTPVLLPHARINGCVDHTKVLGQSIEHTAGSIEWCVRYGHSLRGEGSVTNRPQQRTEGVKCAE